MLYGLWGLHCIFHPLMTLTLTLANILVHLQDNIFRDLRLVPRVGPAYKACLAEVVRRKAAVKLYMGQVTSHGRCIYQLSISQQTSCTPSYFSTCGSVFLTFWFFFQVYLSLQNVFLHIVCYHMEYGEDACSRVNLVGNVRGHISRSLY